MQARRTRLDHTNLMQLQQHQQLPSPHRVGLLKHLILSNLASSPLSSLFFAERLYALDPFLELAVFLLSYCLHKNNRSLEAIHTLRQNVNWSHSVTAPIPPNDPAAVDTPNPFLAGPSHSSTPANNNNNKKGTSNSNSNLNNHITPKNCLKPAIESSLLCARLYAQCCSLVGRDKEGRAALAHALLPSTTLLQPPPDFSLSSLEATAASSTLFDSEPWVYDLQLARLARTAGEHDRAVASYRKALEGNSWCWEALDGLCLEGHPPDTDLLFPPRPSHPKLSPVQTRTTIPLPAPTTSSSSAAPPPPPHASTSTIHQPPPPLGPTQTSAVNGGMVIPKGRAALQTDALGFFTPGESVGGAGPNPVKGKGLGANWKKGRNNDIIEMMSVDDSNNSFESSFYPSQSSIPPLSFVSAQPAYSSLLPSSQSLFTPPPGPSLTPIAPGVKRARGQQPPLASANEDESKIGRRPVRGVPGDKASGSMRRDASVGGGPTRRSSRISAAATATPAAAPGPTSVSMAMSRSTSNRTTTTSSSGNTLAGTTNVVARDKKRTKSGAGPSVLSDAGTGSDILSPNSHSSSPVPSSPGQAHNHQLSNQVDPLVQEAEDYVALCLRGFGKAAAEMSRFNCAKSIEALMALPVEQQKSSRSLLGVARAHLEMLNYDKADKAFAQVRTQAPHLLDSMELYSTLLWHLRSSTALSFLAQDLMSIAPRSPSSWIASGNVFSHLEDHSAALKCFKRAAQLDEDCVYSYTLSGHECVVLEEWERALGFFREAVRRDQRHYNAWFGLGNVYMQTGKYRLAEYHFRKAVEINPSNATLICCIGSVLEKLGRRKEALELYERACLLAPESPAVRFKRVKILIALKQYKTAESDLLALKDRAPNEFNVYFLLGKLYKALDRKSEMLRYFGLAQDLEPRTASLIRETVLKETTSVSGGNADLTMEVDEDLEARTSESGTAV